MATLKNNYSISLRYLKNQHERDLIMKSSKFNVKKHLKILEKIWKFHELDKLDNQKIQKCKYILISELVYELFENRNCQNCYINISNLIILFLTAFEKNYPIDIFTEYHEIKSREIDADRRAILKEEFNFN